MLYMLMVTRLVIFIYQIVETGLEKLTDYTSRKGSSSGNNDSLGEIEAPEDDNQSGDDDLYGSNNSSSDKYSTGTANTPGDDVSPHKEHLLGDDPPSTTHLEHLLIWRNNSPQI